MNVMDLKNRYNKAEIASVCYWMGSGSMMVASLLHWLCKSSAVRRPIT